MPQRTSQKALLAGRSVREEPRRLGQVERDPSFSHLIQQAGLSRQTSLGHAAALDTLGFAGVTLDIALGAVAPAPGLVIPAVALPEGAPPAADRAVPTTAASRAAPVRKAPAPPSRTRSEGKQKTAASDTRERRSSSGRPASPCNPSPLLIALPTATATQQQEQVKAEAVPSLQPGAGYIGLDIDQDRCAPCCLANAGVETVTKR